MEKKLKIAVLVSGGGTNLQSIIDRVEAGKIKAQIEVVISNNSKAYALERARRHNITALHMSAKKYGSQERLDEELLELFEEKQIDLIVLAGYMKLLSPMIVRKYRGRVINIHPGPLPEFGGKGMYGQRVHQAVLSAGLKETCASVHVVDEIYDHGPVLLERKVSVMPDDTPESLAARVLKVEHQILPEVINMYAQGKIDPGKIREDQS
ncbi:MAG: phosphoribosylglycinamide formyltransferase [candidate division Zixibacteria bacterium DG_27]|nr:MAG: phosphoribosylglycinamide formyltransferase [candidate division Zixibacteria bacterium DG_27]